MDDVLQVFEKSTKKFILTWSSFLAKYEGYGIYFDWYKLQKMLNNKIPNEYQMKKSDNKLKSYRSLEQNIKE